MPALKTTLLTPYQTELGAKMVPIYGWNIPLHYSGGSAEEHLHTRKCCSLFDSCPAGKIRLTGTPEALDRLFTLSVAGLRQFQCMYNLLLDERGGVLDRVRVCRMAEDDLLLLADAGSTALLLEHLGKYAETADLTMLLAGLNLRGPDSAQALCDAFSLTEADLPQPEELSTLELDKVRCIVVRDDDGFELLFNMEVVDQLWDLLLETEPVQPAGAGALESLRLEAGIPAFGSEFTRDLSPYEAGLEEMLRKEGDFIGKTALEKRPCRKAAGGMLLAGRRAARRGTRILDGGGKEIGEVTTGCFCPALERAAALCSFEAGLLPETGTELFLELEDVRLPGTTTDLPFVK